MVATTILGGPLPDGRCREPDGRVSAPACLRQGFYVVDDHHHALAPWVLIRRRLDRAPNLITIDHHTDVHEAFLGHAHLETYESGGNPSIEKQAYDADRQARWPQPPTLPPPRRPMTYEDPENHIFVISHDCAIGWALPEPGARVLLAMRAESWKYIKSADIRILSEQ